MLISSREKEIEMIIIILSQPKNLENNKISLLIIINKIIRDIEFPEQNKILKSIKVELEKGKLNEKKLSELVKELKSLG